MGVVYQAVHRMMDRTVALKVISRKLTSRPDAIDRFRQEVKAAAKLNHPNVIVTHDAEQAGDMQLLVMEFIEGISLDRFVEKRGPLPILNACNYVLQAAKGLQHAHEHRMVHRDIKPANLMLTKKGQIKVLDFGLAKLAAHGPAEPESMPSGAGSRSSAALTLAGDILGTADFIAPEQVEESRAVDIRADIYSLGCTLYFLLTGQPPFPKGNARQKLESHRTRRPRAVNELRHDVPPEVAKILEKMLARNPDDRFATPADVVQALAPWSKAQPPKDEWDFGALEREANRPTEPYLPPRAGGAKSHRAPSGNLIAAAFAPVLAPTRQLIRRHRRFAKPAVITAVAGLVLWLIWSFVPWSNLKSSVAALVPTSTGGGGTELESKGQTPPSSTNGSHDPSSSVLLVVPNKMVWMRDYDPVRTALESSGYTVVVASSARKPARPDNNSRNNGASDVPVDLAVSEARASDYAMIVFIGGDVSEFIPDRMLATDSIQNLTRDFVAASKPVTSICAGNAVLAATYAARGHRVADNQFVDQFFDRSKVGDSVKFVSNAALVLDEPFFSARDFNNASEFANKLVWALGRRK
jgi:serine/threonine protein kinase